MHSPGASPAEGDSCTAWFPGSDPEKQALICVVREGGALVGISALPHLSSEEGCATICIVSEQRPQRACAGRARCPRRPSVPRRPVCAAPPDGTRAGQRRAEDAGRGAGRRGRDPQPRTEAGAADGCTPGRRGRGGFCSPLREGQARMCTQGSPGTLRTAGRASPGMCQFQTSENSLIQCPQLPEFSISPQLRVCWRPERTPRFIDVCLFPL